MPDKGHPTPRPDNTGIDTFSMGSNPEAMAHFCEGLNIELGNWKARLDELLAQGATAETLDTIGLIESTVKELETISSRMMSICPTDSKKKDGGEVSKMCVSTTPDA